MAKKTSSLPKKAAKVRKKTSWEKALSEKITSDGLPKSIEFLCGEERKCDLVHNGKRIGTVSEWDKCHMALWQCMDGRANFQSAADVVAIVNTICGGRDFMIRYGEIPLGEGLPLTSSLEYVSGRGSSGSKDLFISDKKLERLVRQHFGPDDEINEENIDEMKEIFLGEACHGENCDTYLCIFGDGVYVEWPDGSGFQFSYDRKMSYEILELNPDTRHK